MLPPFDAPSYDAEFSNTVIGRIQRGLVWKYLEGIEKELPGKAALELNCGTGEDTLFLASRGYSVLATDQSAEMLKITRQKLSDGNVMDRVDIEKLDLNATAGFKTRPPFDLILSDFAGLNCIDEIKLNEVLRFCHAQLRPGGRMIVVLFSTWCWWESLYFLCKFRWGMLFRRQRSPAEFKGLKIWYYSPGVIRRLAGGWEVKNLKPIGLFTPPSYLEPFFRNKQALLRIFKFFDHRLPFSFLSPFADHYLIDLRKP